MALTDDFAGAQARVKALSKTPAPDELLELYALYKQATAGDATGARPWMKSPICFEPRDRSRLRLNPTLPRLV